VDSRTARWTTSVRRAAVLRSAVDTA
jgi:hypothetical protein